MKIALIADIHANLAALQAIHEDLERWRPDVVVVAGDIINRGPQPDECLHVVLRMVAERGWHVIRGNHERYVLQFDRDRLQADFRPNGPRYEIIRPVIWTHRQVAERLASVAALPEQLTLELAGETFVVYHASARHDRDGITPGSSDDELRTQIDPSAAVFCAGHTHVPVVRRLDGTLVVNAGSVGLPFDGDQRAAYARLSRGRAGWQAEIVRVPYAVTETLRAFTTSGALDEVGPLGALMLRELEGGRSLIFTFFPAYQERLMAGVISLADAVQDYLGAMGRAA